MCKSVLLLWAPGMEWEGNLEFRVLSGLHFTNATCCVSLGKMVHLSGPPFFPFHIRAPPDCYSENQMLKRGEAKQLFIHWTYKSFPSHCTLGSQHHFCCCNKYLPKSNLGKKKDLFVLQSQATVHCCGEVEAGTQSIVSIFKSGEIINTWIYLPAFLWLSPPSHIHRPTVYSKTLPTQCTINTTLTGQPDLHNPSLTSLSRLFCVQLTVKSNYCKLYCQIWSLAQCPPKDTSPSWPYSILCWGRKTPYSILN